MQGFAPLLDKEARALFQSPIAWVLIGVFLGLMGYSFTLTLFNNKHVTLVHIFFQAAGLLLLVVPVLTMRLIAEERKSGTLELCSPRRCGRATSCWRSTSRRWLW